MQLLIGLAVLAAGTAVDGDPVQSAWRCFWLSVTIMLLLIVAARLIAWRALRAMRATDPVSVSALREFDFLRRIHFFLWFGSVFYICYVLGWSRLVSQNLHLANWILVDELLALIPVVVPLVASWLLFYEVERSIRLSRADGAEPPRVWSRWNYLIFRLRHHLALSFVPACFIFFCLDLAKFLPSRWMDYGAPLVLAAFLALFPWLLMKLWKVERLPDGDLRTRLEQLARRLQVNVREIYLWHTGRVFGTAAVVGLLPRWRYVLLSDALLEVLSPEEIEVVFAHEAGHVVHHHLSWRVFGMLAVPLSVWVVLVNLGPTELYAYWSKIASGWGISQMQQEILCVLAVFGAFVPTGFRWLSHGFELQADLFACQTVGNGEHEAQSAPKNHSALVPLQGVAMVVNALRKVSFVNSSSMKAASWQHPSVWQRIEFLHRLAENPQAYLDFHRRLFWIRFAMGGTIIAAVASQVFVAYYPEATAMLASLSDWNELLRQTLPTLPSFD